MAQELLPEEELARSNRLLAIISAAQANFIASRPIDELFEDALLSLADITDSPNATLMVVAGEGVSVLATAGHSDPKSHLHVSEVVESGEACVEPDEDWCLVPLKSGGEVLGVVELSGAGSYDQELVYWIEPLTRTYANLLRGYRAESARTEALMSMARARTEADEARRDAEVSDAAKGAMLSRMSHELRTPLNAILGFAQLIELEAADSVAEYNSFVLSAGQNLLALVDEVLEITQANDSTKFEPFDLLGLARELGSPEVSVSGTSVQVVGDRVKVHRAVRELVENALLHGGSTASVGVDGRGTLVVRDFGSGMGPAELALALTPFERLDADARGKAGAGLGLVVARTLVEASGGTLKVESGPGGTAASITLPLAAGIS